MQILFHFLVDRLVRCFPAPRVGSPTNTGRYCRLRQVFRYGKSETARERFFHLPQLPFARALQRFDRPSVIEVDDAVELI